MRVRLWHVRVQPKRRYDRTVREVTLYSLKNQLHLTDSLAAIAKEKEETKAANASLETAKLIERDAEGQQAAARQGACVAHAGADGGVGSGGDARCRADASAPTLPRRRCP